MYSVVAFARTAMALLSCPPGFGLAGVVFGLVGHAKGERLGKWAAVAAAFPLVIGSILILGYWLSGTPSPAD